MTNISNTPNPEPTLADVLEKIDGLSSHVDKLSSEVEGLSSEVGKISQEIKRFDERFNDYRQATQWVVQLAFTLIASATITVILTSIFK